MQRKYVLPKWISIHRSVNLGNLLSRLFHADVTANPVLDGRECFQKTTDGYCYHNQNGSTHSIYVPSSLVTAEARFRSIQKAPFQTTCLDIPFLYESNVAVLGGRHQRGVDLLIPLKLQQANGMDRDQA